MSLPWEMHTLYLRCSFCKRRKADVRRFISGPGAYICEDCVHAANEAISTADMARGMVERNFCCFCSKRDMNVWVVREDPADPTSRRRFSICNQCVSYCLEILREDESRSVDAPE